MSEYFVQQWTRANPRWYELLRLAAAAGEESALTTQPRSVAVCETLVALVRCPHGLGGIAGYLRFAIRAPQAARGVQPGDAVILAFAVDRIHRAAGVAALLQNEAAFLARRIGGHRLLPSVSGLRVPSLTGVGVCFELPLVIQPLSWS
ncbi:hypothetical protein HBA54_06550 [Pelagibius litoralis]|uniref:Uncharacterized protein n=1 Tax=Pelagibius litoralis TaxID=374515 RepID=A0A967CBC4_9PROT|nr:hypothetical protein [Pelagibius litoralis]NIA68248.1 hypothetical protein [Pelagibius litoralis]